MLPVRQRLSLLAFSIQPCNTHSWPQLTTLALLSRFALLRACWGREGEERGSRRGLSYCTACFFWRVPKREPHHEIVKCFRVSTITGRVFFRLRRPVHHNRCGIFSPDSKSDAPAPCTFEGASNVLATCVGFHTWLLKRMDMFEKRVLLFLHLTSKCHAVKHSVCARSHPKHDRVADASPQTDVVPDHR